MALLRLQETGRVEFSLPEVLFDLDFAGHFCRRIKSVALIIPCITGAYTGLCCTLRLVEHTVRMKQNQGDSSYYPESIETDERYHKDRGM